MKSFNQKMIPVALIALFALPAFGDEEAAQSVPPQEAFCKVKVKNPATEARQEADHLVDTGYKVHKRKKTVIPEIGDSFQMFSESVRTIFRKKADICAGRKISEGFIADSMKNVENGNQNNLELLMTTETNLKKLKDSCRKDLAAIETFRKKDFSDEFVQQGEQNSLELIQEAKKAGRLNGDEEAVKQEVVFCWSANGTRGCNIPKLLGKFDNEKNRLHRCMADVDGHLLKIKGYIDRAGHAKNVVDWSSGSTVAGNE